MKLPTLFLIGSLAANAAFVAFYFAKSPSAVETASSAATASTSGTAATGNATKKSAVGEPGAASSDAQLAKAWQQLQGGDLHTLAERLRAAGFPPSVIRAIVSAQVYEQFAARRKALISQPEETPFWATQQRSVMDPKTMAELRELGREQTKLMKELLGPEGYLGSEELQAYQKRQFGDLSHDKLDQMQSIVSDYNELRQQIYQTANGVMLPEDREKLTLLEKEQRADMAKVLSPEELENYDLRSSNTANMLRSQLGTFKPNEEEFRAIFKATQAAEEQYGSLMNVGGNPNQLRQIQAAVLDQLKTQLPPDRVADLKQAVDPAYQQVNRLVARLELPPSAATQVVTVQQDVQKQVAALRSNRELPAEQRNEQIAALAEDATAKLTTALGGTRGLEAYKQYGGQWLQTLAPRPPTGAPANAPGSAPKPKN